MAQPEPKTNTKVVLVIVLVALMGFCLCAGVILSAILFPVFSRAREAARRQTCLVNLKSQALASLMYAQDYDEYFPRVSSWMDTTFPYAKSDEIYKCPSVRNSGGYGYAMDVRISGKSLEKIPSPQTQPLSYDSVNVARNAHDPFTSLPQPPRHLNNNVAYADGHAESKK